MRYFGETKYITISYRPLNEYESPNRITSFLPLSAYGLLAFFDSSAAASGTDRQGTSLYCVRETNK